MAFDNNILNVRLCLKYDSLENWASKNPELKAGEVAIAYLPPKGDGEAPAATASGVLMKVGPGNFNALPWLSALAADVYEWAKKPTPDWADFPALPVEVVDEEKGKFITDIEYDSNKITIHRADVVLDDISDKEKIALSAHVGSVSDLNTRAGTVVAAINEHDEEIGDLSTLYTSCKDDLVGAINEHDTEIGNLASLNTTNKNNLVSAINEALQAVEVGGTGSVVTVTKQATPTNGSEATYVVNQGGKAVDVKIEIPKYDTEADYGVLEVKGDALSGVEIDTTDAQRPIVKIKSNTYDAYGAAEGVKTGVENGTIKAKAAERADDATHADAAAKVDTAITVKVGGADVVFDGSAAKTADVDAAIAAGVAEAKKYADDNDANTAHTHSAGSGTKVSATGGIDGDVKVNLNVAFELVDKTIKLYDKDDTTKTAIATLDATEFIADGMLSSVTADQINNKLVFEWNTDAGVTKTEVELSSIADIYTGVTNTETVTTVKNTNEIEVTLVNKGITTEKIADKAVTEAKLADAVTTKLNKVWEEVGVAQGLINALDYTATGMGAGKTIATLTETDGKIEATFQDIDITHGQVSDFESAVKNIVITNPALHEDEVTIGDLYEHLDERLYDKVNNTASINGKSFKENGDVINIYGDDIAIYDNNTVNRPSVSEVLSEIANTTINGNRILDPLWDMETFPGISQNIVLTGEDIAMSDSDATTLNAAITARQTEAQVNALIKAVLNSITEINCGTSTEVM